MFKVTEGVLLVLSLAGLDAPPDPEGFSQSISNSYFEDAGIDVSLVWMGADQHARMMQQHRDNLASPQQVTVRSIQNMPLGDRDVTEILYDKARPIPDHENLSEIILGREITWQYTWPGDAEHSFALLTIWCTGLDESDTLRAGFEVSKARWTAGAVLPGVLYVITSHRNEGQLVITGLSIEAPKVNWGRISVPVFHDYSTWQVVFDPLPLGPVAMEAEIVLDMPHPNPEASVAEQLAQLEVWLIEWATVFEELPTHLAKAAPVFRAAVQKESDDVDLSGGLEVFELTFNEEDSTLQVHLLSNRKDEGTHEGWVQINAKGELIATEVFW